MNYNDYQSIIFNKIKNLNKLKKNNELYNSFNYILSIKGKYIRPILCIIGHNLFKNYNKNIINIALGLELLHNSFLIHDDIMDNSSIRRGVKCIHKKLGNNKAILLGNILIIKSYQLFQNLNPLIFKKIVIEFSKMAIKICQGQYMDLYFENIINIKMKEYINMIKYKTAIFMGISLKIGAIIANADKKNIYYLYEIGKNIGIAYQIKNDLLDVFSNTNKTGKENNKDIYQNKKTILYVKALEKANNTQKKELLYWYNIKKYSNEKINCVKKIFHDLSIKNDINKEFEKYKNKSLLFFNKISMSKKKKKMLFEFIQKT